MATRRKVNLSAESYGLLKRESERRGVRPDDLASELLRAKLADDPGEEDDLDRALADVAAFRATLPPIDGLALARAAREELEQRGL